MSSYVAAIPQKATADLGRYGRRWRTTYASNINLSTSLDVSSLTLTPQASAPANPAAGTVAFANGTAWNPASLAGSAPYPVFHTGSEWKALGLAGSAGAGVTAWSPCNLAPVLWLDASRFACNATVPLGIWSGPIGPEFSQSGDATLVPTLLSTGEGIGSLNAVALRGIQYLQASSAPALSTAVGASMYAVIRPAATGNTPWKLGSSATAYDYVPATTTGAVSLSVLRDKSLPCGSLTSNVRIGVPTLLTVRSLPTRYDANVIVAGRLAQFTSNASAAALGSVAWTAPLYLGNPGNNLANVDIGELMVFSPPLVASNEYVVEAYLQKKWGLVQ